MDRQTRDRYVHASDALTEAAKPLRVLSALRWAPEVRQRFLDGGARSMPEPTYPVFDPSATREAVTRVRADLHPADGVVDAWLDETARQVLATAEMMAAVGTKAFHQWSSELYGAPRATLRFAPETPLGLAKQIVDVLGRLIELEIGLTPPPSREAEDVAAEIRTGLATVFGGDSPPVTVVDDLSANASATAKGIRLRRGALFTDRDALQLLQHEAFIHVATALNGRRQDLRVLGVGHPGTARTQEGLAVFAEIMSQAAELDRMRRLADRVLAIEMAEDGADFLEVFRWFRDRTPTDEQAFESTRRVFRGGVLTGGAPFTKDVVYLYGLLQVANTVRTAFAAGRVDILRLLFVGKVDVSALPALTELAAAGLVTRPPFVPPWVRDPRSVLASLTLTTFLSRIDLPAMVTVAEELLAACPEVAFAED